MEENKKQKRKLLYYQVLKNHAHKTKKGEKSAIVLPYYQLSSATPMDRSQSAAIQNEQKQIPGPDGIHLRVLCEVKDERAE